MGEATEHLAHYAGPGLGGLLNATFGNAAELIIGFIALRAGEIAIVKASLTGSILGNLLMVLGLAMLVGGSKHKELTFNRLAAETGSGMMVLAVVSLVIPPSTRRSPTTRTPAHRGAELRHLVRAHRDLHREPALPVPHSPATLLRPMTAAQIAACRAHAVSRPPDRTAARAWSSPLLEVRP